MWGTAWTMVLDPGLVNEGGGATTCILSVCLGGQGILEIKALNGAHSRVCAERDNTPTIWVP